MTQTVWTDLPYEIIYAIAGYLENLSDILQLQLTCKKWSRPAQERFYRDAAFTEIEQVESFIDTVVNSRSLPGT
jgi:hypothetical protein